MKIIKSAEITVRSVIDNLEDGLAVGEPEITVITSRGSLTCSDGAYMLKYTERAEESVTECELRISGAGVSLSRRGSVVCDLLFEEGERCNTVYSVPPYKFDMTVRTRKIRSSLGESGGEVQLIYSMNIGGQDKDVRMRIAVRTEDA